jgi:hypothetical protein
LSFIDRAAREYAAPGIGLRHMEKLPGDDRMPNIVIPDEAFGPLLVKAASDDGDVRRVIGLEEAGKGEVREADIAEKGAHRAQEGVRSIG